MVAIRDAFPGFSVDDIAAAREFYGSKLGLAVADEAMGGLRLTLPSGQPVFVYPKPDHEPAGFTILNFVVADIEQAVDELNAAGVETKIYTEGWAYGTDERGIAHGSEENPGPNIAWFRDPSGNVLSVIEM
ncbi:catechol 2,3-dioxygenase-like lactoylglutathione lyase family enzyme [Agromyces flavus]|uniref:Catechol 2,3-dioxygenase n=1 Tax=Agromyces flavus TaxID=589382 RepID=A0A1H1N7H3_9MICO|nr:VOC family protein [Agromyces flavus]MCP2369142.1 catechol 2,3-dioxygenase-like lactoylglutathione lyase family enzyme [Agromyces flavus]GGI48622.1 glyoxalase [Agromyces flavus]SDR94877.1 Catechol 2,3-dioxygenase [Agromyces flavus]